VVRVRAPDKLLVPARQSQISLDRTGRILASVDHSGGWVLDLDNPQAKARHLSHESATFVATSPDGRWVATGAHHGQGVKVWDARSGEMLRHLIADEVGARASFSPNGRWLITETSQDFRLWHTASWEQVWHLRREQPFFNRGAAFSPDSRVLALTMSLSAVRLCNPSTGDVLATLQVPDVAPLSLVGFSPAGRYLVVLAWPGEVGVWDLRSVREQLQEIGLDWALPEHAEAAGASEPHLAPIEKVEFMSFPAGLPPPGEDEEADP
jgi:WD40 repeat protein